MRRLLVLLSLLSLSALVAGVGGLGITACGGNDKPPLTPDTVEPSGDNPDSGTATPPSTGTATPPK
jgi:hypothetical protein